MPQFRVPRAHRAQHTEVALGVLLGAMLIGLGELIRRWDVVPHSGTTVLAQLTAGAIGHGVLFYIIQMITLVLLALAANTSFGGLPVLAGPLCRLRYRLETLTADPASASAKSSLPKIAQRLP